MKALRKVLCSFLCVALLLGCFPFTLAAEEPEEEVTIELTDEMVSEVPDEEYVYTGSEIKPEIIVTDDDGEELVPDEDYTVEYKDNIDAGEATIIITGIGLYSGEVIREFTIKKAKTKVLFDAKVLSDDTILLTAKVVRADEGETIPTGTVTFSAIYLLTSPSALEADYPGELDEVELDDKGVAVFEWDFDWEGDELGPYDLIAEYSGDDNHLESKFQDEFLIIIKDEYESPRYTIGSSSYKTSPALPPTEPVEPTAADIKVTAADALYRLGLFVGTGTDSGGKPTYELNKKLTRLEALALVIRLMGLEKDAKAYAGVNPFNDVPDWGDRYAAFGYFAGITVGVNSEHTLFASERQVTLQEFTAFLLRVLGYTEANGDFKYENAIQQGTKIGLYSPYDLTEISSGSFLRGNAVLAMAGALLTKPKGGDVELVYELAELGVFPKADADWFKKEIGK